MRLIVESESALNKAAEELISFSGDQRIWIFYGEMGSGKTTLIKAIAEQFDVEDNVHSPTFNIVNEYRNCDDKIFYHFDFYRIKSESEAMDIGVEEYFDSGELCFVEWPEKIPSLIPDQYLKVELEIISNTARKINLSHHGR